MIIRSQDKGVITTDLNLWIRNEIVGYEIENNDFKLGTYSTEEKAIKVLDMIQKRYQSIWDVENGFIRGEMNFSSVFQMPQDSEV